MGLSHLDFAIIAVYLAGITLFGLHFRKRHRSLRDYFLAGRDIPWWAISLSIVAAETSTLTIVSMPGLAYDTNMTFLQVAMGYIVGRIIIGFLLLPQYFRGDLYTAYELIGKRFGPKLRSLTSGLFLLTRAAAEGVRVYAVSIVVSIALDTGEVASIAIITALTLIYTFEGGLAAVIWSDVVQTGIYVGGTIVGVAVILHYVPGGWAHIHQIAAAHGKLRIFDFSPSLWKPYTFWAGLIGGTFFTIASHGTDQLIVQRLLAARNQRESAVALVLSGVMIFFLFALFLVLGLMLFAYYLLPTSHFGTADRIYPTFIVTRMPHGISGLLIAAILAEFAFIEHGTGLVFAPSPANRRTQANATLAARDGDMGRHPAWAGRAVSASRRTRGRSRTANRVSRLWRAAWSVSAWSPHPPHQSEWRHAGHALRIRD
jgi:Na+/proline symporter